MLANPPPRRNSLTPHERTVKLARRNLSERVGKQKANNSELPLISEFTPGQKVLVYKPHQSYDGPNPKLIQPGRGPYIILVCSKLSPVVYRIQLPDDTKQVSIHLAHIKSHRPRQSAPAPDFHKLEKLFLAKTLPAPAWKEYKTVPPHIGIYQITDVVGRRRGQGRQSPRSYVYPLRLKGFGPEADLEYRGRPCVYPHRVHRGRWCESKQPGKSTNSYYNPSPT